jgi:hypothetical protein
VSSTTDGQIGASGRVSFTDWCTVSGCWGGVKARGLCSKHHMADKRIQEPLYGIWVQMKQRCSNPRAAYYDSYGGRGIRVCESWVNSFAQFKIDMGERPSGTSLDRIDNDGDYEPSNCRWATQREQNLNQRIRNDNKVGVRGVMYDAARKKYRAYINKHGKQLWSRRFNTLEEAVKAREIALAELS